MPRKSDGQVRRLASWTGSMRSRLSAPEDMSRVAPWCRPEREATKKIGRFGLGFNSVYNFTDLPSILSDDVVLFLDPHVRHLQATGAGVGRKSGCA